MRARRPLPIVLAVLATSCGYCNSEPRFRGTYDVAFTDDDGALFITDSNTYEPFKLEGADPEYVTPHVLRLSAEGDPLMSRVVGSTAEEQVLAAGLTSADEVVLAITARFADPYRSGVVQTILGPDGAVVASHRYMNEASEEDDNDSMWGLRADALPGGDIVVAARTI